MAKVVKIKYSDSEKAAPTIFCPGCKCSHVFDERWTFNGDYDKPTFSPSMLVNGGGHGMRCHSFIQNGKIMFLSDCDHELKSQTVDLPDFEE